MELPKGKTILSGIQPSGDLHLGNYLGALKQWVALQDNNNAYYCIVDLHAIIVPYDAEEFPGRVLDTAAMNLAVGIDPKTSTLFVQSHVPAHTELAWLLGTNTPFGELTRMTQFKDKAARQQDSTSFGIFAYPVLMAADILLYQADIVPVGDDQIQHIELTRDIANRFNNKFGDLFNVPTHYVPKDASRVMSLADPIRKMSKSDGEKSYLALKDDNDTIRKKIMGAVTETEPVFSFSKSGPAVKNLLSIYKVFTDKSEADIEQEFASKGYKEFKETLADTAVSNIEPIRQRFEETRSDESRLQKILQDGAEKANEVASNTLKDVKIKMGLL